MNPNLRPPRDSTEAELEAFDRTCLTLQGFDAGFGFELADGFLTALAATPHAPPADEWIPALCGDAFERAFGDPEAQAAARAALQARLDVLRDHLDPEALMEAPDRLRLAPLVAEYGDDDRRRMVEEGMPADEAEVYRTGVWWAEGFFECVGRLPQAWAVPEQPADARAAFDAALEAVDVLRWDADHARWPAYLARIGAKEQPSRDALLDEACWAVQDLRLFWVDFAPVTAPRRVEAAPGRNDPCPCGSGRKFKKCHGAAA